MPGDTDSDLADLGAVEPLLEGSGWVAIRELGRGGGGLVLLCARQETVAAIDAYGATAGQRMSSRALGASRASPAMTLANRLERVIASARAHDGIAALKVPHLGDADPAEGERFRREVDATEQYVHPALIRFIDRDRRNPPRWFAMEYHARGNLAEPANRVKYLGEPLAVLSDVRPIADALGLVHHGGAVHRDVKPKNIFVADGGNLVLGDFGIVVPAPEATRLTAIEPAHSRDWVPDWVQFGEERRYTKAVDVFALAKVMYYLLAGENVMASQLYREIEALRTRYSGARAIIPTLALLEKCIVDREDKCVVTDGAALVKEIDVIVTAEAAQSPKQMLFSWLSTHAMTDIELPPLGDASSSPMSQLPPIPRLSGIQVFLGRPTDRVVGRARICGTAATLEIGIGGATSERARLPGVVGHDEAAWSEEFIVRTASPLTPGWHELVVRAGGRDARISGLLLYAS